MLVKVEHRFSKGFSVINSFTWSKLFEDTSWTGPEIAGRNVEHKLGGEDRPFHLSIAPIWQIPVGRKQKFGRDMPKAARLRGRRLAALRPVQHPVRRAGGLRHRLASSAVRTSPCRKDQQSLNQWFDTAQFIRFPAKNTDISTYPAWTGVQNLPGYNYKPAASDTTKNGVYQDFATYIRNYPTRWGNVRASRTNNVDAVISKNFNIREKVEAAVPLRDLQPVQPCRASRAPNSDPTSSSFGMVGPPRSRTTPALVQMALKLSF